jgi:hypothetical protein
MTRPPLSLHSRLPLPPTKLTLTTPPSLRRSLIPIFQPLNTISTLHLQQNNSKFLARNILLPQRSQSPILPPLFLPHSHVNLGNFFFLQSNKSKDRDIITSLKLSAPTTTAATTTCRLYDICQSSRLRSMGAYWYGYEYYRCVAHKEVMT